MCNVELLKPLLKDELQLVADTPERVEYVAGRKILEEGVCEWSKSNGELELRQGKEAKRVATVTAVSGRAVRQVRAAGGGVHGQAAQAARAEQAEEGAEGDEEEEVCPQTKEHAQQQRYKVCPLKQREVISVVGKGPSGWCCWWPARRTRSSN